MSNVLSASFWNGAAVPPSARAVLLGFIYWFAFLIALEPGNILATSGQLDPGQECLRIAGAAILGASFMPLLLTIARRFPLWDGKVWRNVALQLAGSLAISVLLIVISCILADWFLASEHRPLALALREEFEVNWPLVAFCVTGLVALANTRLFQTDLRDRHSAAAIDKRPKAPAYLTEASIKERGRLIIVPLADVNWIEAQGNYLVLHCGARAYMLRESLRALEKRLDPDLFVRVHRGAVVAIGCVRRIVSLGAGDASLQLADGTELRLSRTYRRTFLAAANPAQSE